MADRPAPPHENAGDDEQLMRVLAESVQSEAQREAGRADELHALDRLRTAGGYVKHSPFSPAALVPSMPVYTAVALALQALYAVPHAREAFLAYPLAETIESLESYWAGAPARRKPSAVAIPDAWAEPAALVQRVQTLFTMMQHTSRAAVVLGDLVDTIPREVFLQASRSADMHTLMELFFESLVHAYVTTMPLGIDQIVGTTRTETQAARAKASANVRGLFQSFAAVAQPEAPADGSVPAPGEAQPTATITLLHTETDRCVPACLFAKLMANADMDSLLITHAADVLLFNVQHKADATPPAFQIDREISLAPFLWDTQRGRRIDADARWQQLHVREAEKEALETERARLVAPGGTPLAPLLRSAQRVGAAGEAYTELATWLHAVQHALEEDVAAMDARIRALYDELRATRTALLAELPSIQDAPVYALCAVLYASSTGDCAYVLENDSQWYRVAQGCAERVAWDAVCQDPRGQDEGRGVFHLAYVKTPVAPMDTDALTHAAPSTVQAVCQDNARANETRSA